MDGVVLLLRAPVERTHAEKMKNGEGQAKMRKSGLVSRGPLPVDLYLRSYYVPLELTM